MITSLPAVLVAAVGAVLLSCVLSLTVIAGDGQAVTTATATSLTALAAQYAAETCGISGPIPAESQDAAKNADQIVSAVMSLPSTDFPGGPAEVQQVAQIALMTAITESSLLDLRPGAGDLDSVGLFQQRPSMGWGTDSLLIRPSYATDAFVLRLLQVPGWQQMPPWQAAQAVQRSAISDGSNYRKNLGAAKAELTKVEAASIKVDPTTFQASAGRAQADLAAVLANGNAPGSCGQGTDGSTVPLPSTFTMQPGTPPAHAAVVTWALQQLGKRYQYGGNGPDAFDCSGLTQQAWDTVGVSLGRTTEEQQSDGVDVAQYGLLQPGDLVLTVGSDPGPAGSAGHVGIYLGDDLVLSAIDEQDGVAIQTWATFTSGPTGKLIALRDPAPGR